MAAPTEVTRKESHASVKGILILSRLPFLLPGLAALITGISIGIADGFDGESGLTVMAVTGIAFIMLATYYFNEYFDFDADVLNKKFIATSGGSRAIPEQLVPRSIAKVAGWFSVAVLVVFAATYIVLYFRDFPLLLPLGLFGAFCGIFYTHTPFQWSYKGIGEIIIGGCYGILAVVSGYYAVSARLEPRMILIALPASLSIFCVIMSNEFPDYESDRAINKLNLVVRMGLKPSSNLYAIAMTLVYPAMLASVLVGVDWRIAIFGLPVLVLSALAVSMTLNGGYKERGPQTKIAAMTIIANLLSSLMFIPVALFW